MKVKLLEDRKYRGASYKKDDVIEVASSLGGNLILNGIGVRVSDDTEVTKATVKDSKTVQKNNKAKKR